MALCRVNIPAIVVPGGTMNAGPDMLTLEQLGMYSARYQRGEIDEEKLNWAKHHACPGCGACSFIGTASTMQIMAEALGLALPGSALMPASSPEAAGGGLIALVEEGDLIEIDVMERKLNIIGVRGGEERMTPQEMDEILKERRNAWKKHEVRYKAGALRLFSEHAVSPMKGGGVSCVWGLKSKGWENAGKCGVCRHFLMKNLASRTPHPAAFQRL